VSDLTQEEKRQGYCTCFNSPSCEWCISLSEEEVDAFSNGGRDGLERYWDKLEEREETATAEDDPVGFQSAPVRYMATGRETIDRIRDELGDEGFVAFCLGNAIKYEDRAGLKGAAEPDHLKSRWYRAMAAHVRGQGPDPRMDRPEFQPYQRPASSSGRMCFCSECDSAQPEPGPDHFPDAGKKVSLCQ